jgi:ubiquinone biosynthesis protein
VEAQNCVRFARNFAGDASIRFPGVFAQASARRLITLEYLDGLKVTDAVRAGASGKWVAENAVRIILKMIFEDGFFHADPHPGNVLIMPRPLEEDGYGPEQPLTIGLLDLGLVGRLSPELRDRAVDLLGAAARNDAEAIAEAMLAIGRARGRVDRDAFRRYVRSVADRHLGKPLKDLQAAELIRDILAGAVKFQIEIPTELTMMLRALMTVEGVGKEIYPELDLLAVAKPYLTKMLWQRFHPLKLGGELLRGAERLGTLARHLPFQVQEILDDLRRGRLELRVNDPPRTGAVERLGRRIRAGLVFVALLGGGIAAHIDQRGDPVAWVLMTLAGIWLLGHLLMDRRLRRP